MITKPDSRGWPFDERAQPPPHTMVLEGAAIDALVQYARKWKDENDRIAAERRARGRR